MVFSTPKNPAALKVSLASIVILASGLVESALRVIISELVSLIVSAENVIFFAVPVAASKPLIVESLISIDAALNFKLSLIVSMLFLMTMLLLFEITTSMLAGWSFVIHSRSCCDKLVSVVSIMAVFSPMPFARIFILSTPLTRLETSR